MSQHTGFCERCRKETQWKRAKGGPKCKACGTDPQQMELGYDHEASPYKEPEHQENWRHFRGRVVGDPEGKAG